MSCRTINDVKEVVDHHKDLDYEAARPFSKIAGDSVYSFRLSLAPNAPSVWCTCGRAA